MSEMQPKKHFKRVPNSVIRPSLITKDFLVKDFLAVFKFTLFVGFFINYFQHH